MFVDPGVEGGRRPLRAIVAVIVDVGVVGQAAGPWRSAEIVVVSPGRDRTVPGLSGSFNMSSGRCKGTTVVFRDCRVSEWQIEQRWLNRI
jgi:hypothetical protein